MQPATRTPHWLDLRPVQITVFIALAVMAAQLIPDAAGWLQFDRLPILEGQWWRMLTGHLTHWNLDHLFWDLLMFVVLGAMVEKLSRPRFVLLVLAAVMSISLMVLWGRGDLRTYRGLSGIDTGLGHQAIGLACGGRVVRAPAPVHGKTSAVEHDGLGVFAGMGQGFEAGRYHSLIARPESLPATLEVTARTPEGEIMGVRHKDLMVEGVQFHPESVLTPDGPLLLGNFLKLRDGRRGS